MPSLVKISADDTDFEQSFFSLAYQQLQNKLGNLLPYLVGFEVVNKSDDGTKALGVFGFRSKNGQILYVPVFFINGSVKGMDLLYSKNHSQFYPLNEDFAEQFLNDDVGGVGNASNETRDSVQKDIPSVDMRDLVRPPRTGIYAYASEGDSKGVDESPLLSYVETGSRQIKKAFAAILEEHPAYMEQVVKFYGMDKVADALAGFNVINPGPKTTVEGDIQPSKNDQIDILEPKNPRVKGLSPADKETLLTQGYIIIDKRPEDHKAQFGVVKFTEDFHNAQETGFYPYITSQGLIRLGLVLLAPMRLQQPYATNDAIVLDLDSKEKGQAYIVDPKHLFVKDQIHVKNFGEVIKMFTDINEAKPSFDATYILINDRLHCSTPFRIISSVKDASGIRRIKIELFHQYCDHDHYRLGERMNNETTVRSARQLPKERHDYDWVPSKNLTLVVTKQPGDRISIKGDMIYVPAGFKVLNLNFGTPSYGFISDADGDTGSSDERKLKLERRLADWEAGKPGKISALMSALYEKNVFPLTLRQNGSSYYVSLADYRKRYDDSKLAKIGMVVDFGLGVKEASELIDGLTTPKPVKGYLKRAYTGDNIPYYEDEQPYINELGNPTTSGIEQQFIQPSDNQQPEDPSLINRGNGERWDPNDMASGSGSVYDEVNKAVNLAQGGQKEIFDVQSIATLAKYVSPSDKINDYLPYLISALDRLGRLIFLVHFESDKFKELYGRNDLPEFVELLTSVFKNMGDLVIFLKRKSPELSINMADNDKLGE